MTKTPINETEVFQVAVKMAPEQRAVYLNQVCRDNPGLRSDVESLLLAHDGQGSFLDQSALAATASVAPRETPGSMIGPYKIREQIGEGGFGFVYVAEQESPIRRKVALKVIKPGMDSKDVIARFDAERQALAMMDHPNVAKVFDAGSTDHGRLYFVMELVQGLSITDFCNKNRLPTRQRLLLLADVARAIHHAHQKGIIHRDLKPSNVMVTLHDSKPVVKVIDFGIAKALNQRISERSIYTAYGQMIGTPCYMSPEQAELSGLGVDTRSDIYSLGVLAYELLTGETPLDAKRLRESAYAEILRIIREEEPPRPSQKVSTLAEQASGPPRQHQTDLEQLRRELSGDIDWIVMKCLEKDRSRRYETANALVRDIERYVNDDPIEARPPSIGYQLKKFSRKHLSLIATVTAFAVLLLAATGVSSWLALEARTSRQRAEREAVKASESLKEETRQRELANSSEAAAEAAKQQLRKSLYVSKLNLIQAAWDRQQFHQVRSLLDSLIPESGESDLRRFEWHVWNNRLRNCMPEVREHPGAFREGILRCGLQGPRMFIATKEMPQTDSCGTPLVTEGSEWRNVAVSAVDVTTGSKIGEWTFTQFEKPNGAVSLSRSSLWTFDAFEVSADGSRMAIILDTEHGSRVAVYDTETRASVIESTHSDAVSGLNLSRNGSRLAVISHPRSAFDDESVVHGFTCKILDTRTEQLIYELSEPERNWKWWTVVLSPDGRQLSRTIKFVDEKASASKSGCLFELIDIETDKRVWQTDLDDFDVKFHAWSPDGRWLALRLDDVDGQESIGLFDPSTGKRRRQLFFDTPSNAGSLFVQDIVFSPDSQRIASFSENKVDVWQIPSSAQEVGDGDAKKDGLTPAFSLVQPGNPLLAIAFSADSTELFGVSPDTSLRWPLEQLNPRKLALPIKGSISYISSDGKRLAVMNDEKQYSIWSTLTQQRVCELEQPPDEKSAWVPYFSDDNRRVINLEEDDKAQGFLAPKHVCVYDGESGKLIRRFEFEVGSGECDLNSSGDAVAAVVRHAGQRHESTAEPGADLQLWDVASGKLIRTQPLQPINLNLGFQQLFQVFCVQNGTELAIPGIKSKNAAHVNFYSSSSLEFLRTVELTSAYFKIDRSRRVICENRENGDVVVRSLLTGEILVRLPAAHKDAERFALSHDGSRIATVGSFHSQTFSQFRGLVCELIIWDMETGDRLLSAPLLDASAYFVQMAFTPDDRQLVIAYPDQYGFSLTILDATHE